jgi:radical SAM-linked protein
MNVSSGDFTARAVSPLMRQVNRAGWPALVLAPALALLTAAPSHGDVIYTGSSVVFSGSNAGVRADLESRVGQGGFAEGDVYLNIEALIGTDYADELGGNGFANRLEGGDGDAVDLARQAVGVCHGDEAAGVDRDAGDAGIEVLGCSAAARRDDRAIRRAAIPLSFTGGFHPGPRISIANALTLGYTSKGEIVDFELTQTLDLENFRQRLQAQLPSEIPIYRAQEVPLKDLAATGLLDQAEYEITVSSDIARSQEQWQSLVTNIMGQNEILWEETTKSGKKAEVNLRDRLFKLTLTQILDLHCAQLNYLGACRNDGTILQPEHIVYCLEKLTGQEFSLVKVHRKHLILQSQ